MTAKHILYLTNTGIASLVARGGRITDRKVFPIASAGKEDFAQRIKANRSLPTYLLTDLAEEDFRLDTIPHVGGRDRDAILGRKLTQLFRNTPYRYAIAQGREADGRRDDRVVYMAITNGELLHPWIEVLERLKVPVEGIYSSAVLSGQLLDLLKIAFAHTLLVTFTPGGAVRQTYFRNREIKFSRLTPVDLDEGDTLGSLLAGETARTWQYLDSLRYFGPEDRLEICVLLHQSDRPAIEPVLRDYDRIRYRLIDIEQAATKVGLATPPKNSNVQGILAHLFLRRAVENHYAPAELRRYAVLRKARIAINSAAAIVLGIGLAYGGWNLSHALKYYEDDLQTAKQILALNSQQEEILRSLPSQDVGGLAMRDTVAFYRGSLREYPMVGAFLLPISTVLERYPGVRLTQVAWQAANDENALAPIVASTPRDAPPIKAVGKALDPGQAPPTQAAIEAADATFANGRFAVATLEGTVTVDGLGFRDALSQIDRLAADLNKLAGYRASIIDSPLDVTPKATIQGRFSERTLASSQARFSIKVSRATEQRQ